MSTQTTLARPYAKAAFEYAQEHKKLDQWKALLSTLSVLMNNAEIQFILHSPKVADVCVVDVLLSALKTKDMGMANFLAILAEKHRLVLLPEINALFIESLATLNQTINVSLESAYPVSDKFAKTISDLLAKKFQKSVALETHVSPELIGGAVIRAGDYVIDGSMASKLKRLAYALVV